MKTTLYVEHRLAEARRGKIRIVPHEDLDQFRGHATIFPFDDEIKQVLEITGSTRDAYGMPVYAVHFYADFDDNIEAAEQFREWLMAQKLHYRLYDSGNRSFHFQVTLDEPMYGANVPQQHKLWANKYASGCDLQIYRPFGLLRLPGTFHRKNPGHRKVLLEECGTEALRIKRVEKAPSHLSLTPMELETSDYERILIKLLLRHVEEGERNLHLYKILLTCRRLNKSVEVAIEEALRWNSNKCVPALPEHVIDDNVRSIWGLNGRVALR